MTVRVLLMSGVPAAAPAMTPARAPDLLDLYGVLAEAALDLGAAAVTLYDAHRLPGLPPATAVATARRAAAWVLRALAEHDASGPSGGGGDTPGDRTYIRVAVLDASPISDNPRAPASVARGRR
jgi:hypothetical protein